MNPLESHPLRDLFTVGGGRGRRHSSWDRTGGNTDYITVGPGETATLAEIDGPGIVNHLYFALAVADPLDFRHAVIRIFWDSEQTPSVEVPLGDFFCVAHASPRPIGSALVSVIPGSPGSYGMNAYFPMPFATGALITLEHEGDLPLGGTLGALWYHVDWEELEQPPPESAGRFHAQWRREPLTLSADPAMANLQLWAGTNVTGEGNYVVLEAEGCGRLAGLHLQVDNVAGGWWGEGDDMIFVDGEAWPPGLHGTGTEEVFGAGACPDSEVYAPYSGLHLIEHAGGRDWAGKNGMFRWFVNDPVRFAESVHWTIEHGHANNFENDYTSVAYWYQTEPHAPFPPLPAASDREPRFDHGYHDARAVLAGLPASALAAPGAKTANGIQDVFKKLGEAYEALYALDPAAAVAIAREAMPPDAGA